MKTIIQKEKYPDFEVSASSISKFIAAGDLFTLMLKNGKIIHHNSNDPEGFMQWLLDNNVINIKTDQIRTR